MTKIALRKLALASAAVAFAMLGAFASDAVAAGKKISQDDQLNAVRGLLLVQRSDFHFLSSYPIALANGLSGDWAQAQGTEEDKGTYAQLAAKVCVQTPVNIDASDPLHLRFSRNRGNSTIITEYNNVGGNVYAERTDAAQLAEANGYDITNGPGQLGMARAGDDWNGISTMLRPTPDILIIQPNLAIPRTYIRCSK